jgi:hypothetical protein
MSYQGNSNEVDKDGVRTTTSTLTTQRLNDHGDIIETATKTTVTSQPLDSNGNPKGETKQVSVSTDTLKPDSQQAEAMRAATLTPQQKPFSELIGLVPDSGNPILDTGKKILDFVTGGKTVGDEGKAARQIIGDTNVPGVYYNPQ